MNLFRLTSGIIINLAHITYVYKDATTDRWAVELLNNSAKVLLTKEDYDRLCLACY